MNGLSKSLLVWSAFLSALTAAGSVELNIPPRRQWDNDLGYCGECGIQQIAMYYGSYISQYRARELVDPTLQRDVRVPRNSGPIFRALKLRAEKWDAKNRPRPQYREYLAWIKDHLRKGHPVLMDMFMDDGNKPTYDHIVAVTGFRGDNHSGYNPGDTLVFNDNYWRDPIRRLFKSLPDTRAMRGNGSVYSYCIPLNVDYGCAVTGIEDRSGALMPVSVLLDRWDEPNLSQGEEPVMLRARVRMRGLTKGESYCLMRFDDYNRVPTSHYIANAWSRIWIFKAKGPTALISDQFMSDGIVIYRCIPTWAEEAERR